MSNTQQPSNGQLATVEHVNQDTGEITTVNSGSIGHLAGVDADLRSQIATARQYPRSVKAFRNKVLELCTLNETIAAECIYALPRAGKTIEGPSVRFAEIVLSAWGNCRVGSKVIGEEGNFLICQGMFHDLETNSAIAMEVKRRITDGKGKRYNDDMIGVAGAAGSAIALRNSILRGVPKAFWADMYESARQVVAGDFKTLANRRHAALQAFVIYGVTEDQIYNLLGIKALEDMTLDHLVQLRGVLNAIKDNAVTPEDVFGAKAGKIVETRPDKADVKKPAEKKAAETAKATPEPEEVAPAGAQNGEQAEPSADLTRFIKMLAAVKDAGEIEGMRGVLRADLSAEEFGVWQAEALRKEAAIKKAARK